MRPVSASPFSLGDATLACSVAGLPPESWLGKKSSTPYLFYVFSKGIGKYGKKSFKEGGLAGWAGNQRIWVFPSTFTRHAEIYFSLFIFENLLHQSEQLLPYGSQVVFCLMEDSFVC